MSPCLNYDHVMAVPLEPLLASLSNENRFWAERHLTEYDIDSSSVVAASPATHLVGRGHSRSRQAEGSLLLTASEVIFSSDKDHIRFVFAPDLRAVYNPATSVLAFLIEDGTSYRFDVESMLGLGADNISAAYQSRRWIGAMADEAGSYWGWAIWPLEDCRPGVSIIAAMRVKFLRSLGPGANKLGILVATSAEICCVPFRGPMWRMPWHEIRGLASKSVSRNRTKITIETIDGERQIAVGFGIAAQLFEAEFKMRGAWVELD